MWELSYLLTLGVTTMGQTINETGSRQVLRTEQAAEVLNVKRSTLEMWRCRGIGPVYVKMPGPKGAVRYHRHDLEQFLAQNRHVPSVRANMELHT
jgi:hypothetical protein